MNFKKLAGLIFCIVLLLPGISWGYLGEWKFDGNGNEALGGPSAVPYGATFYTTGGISGGYAYIPSSIDWIEIPWDTAFDLPDSFTIEFWFRQRTDQSFAQDLVYKGITGSYNFLIFRQLWNQFNYGPVIAGFTSISGGFWKQVSNPNQLAHGVWHYVAYTKDASGHAYYLDGVLIHSATTTDVAKILTSQPIIIGDSAVDTDIDELRISNIALTPTEISDYYNSFAPTANAGSDQTVGEGVLVTLDGSFSTDPDGSIDYYLWEQIGGTLVTLSNPTTVQTTFDSPFVAESLTFQLTVTDNDGLSATDSVVIEVTSGPGGSVAPVAKAGSNQSVGEGVLVTLDGSLSTDSDGSIVSYLWEQIGGTSVTLSNPTTVQTTFDSPFVGAGGESLTFQLTVTDNEGLWATDSVVIVVTSGPGGNLPPVANDQSLSTAENTPVSITLTGSDSDGDNLTYSVIDQPYYGTLTGTAPNLTYTPSAGYIGTDGFTFKVNDGTTDSGIAVVTITISWEGYVGEWKFDGNGNNEVSGGPSAVPYGATSFYSTGGISGGYAYIASGADYMEIPWDAAIDLPDSFTIEFWFRQRMDQSFAQDLVYKGTYPNNYNFRIFRQLWDQFNYGPVIAGFTSNSTDFWKQVSNPNQLAHGVWHYVAYTKDASGHAYYLDGVLIHSDTATDVAKIVASQPIVIGDSAVDTDIDELRISNTALTATDISDYYNSFVPAGGDISPEIPAALSPYDGAIFAAGPVTLQTSAFFDYDGDTHVQTHWLVRRADRVYKCPDYDPSFDHVVTMTGLTEHTVSGLDPGMKYVWKVGYVDSGSGEISWSEEYTFKIGTYEWDSGVWIYPGTSAVDYKMVSFVHWPDDPACASVFADEMGGSYDRINFRIGTYDPTSGTGVYRECGSNLEIEPGRAYWVLARNGTGVTVNGVQVSQSHDIEVGLRYNPGSGDGWNMIACPNNGDYYWEDVEVLEYDSYGNIVSGPTAISYLSVDNGLIDTSLWRWENGVYYFDTTWMERHKGYWVRARKENVFLRFPASARIGFSNPATLFASLLSEGKSLVKAWILSPEQVIANPGDSPPAPMGDFRAGTSRGNPSGEVGGDVGCFIATAAHGRLYP